ncbi:polyhydroxyalkanoate synthesis regulator [Evansella sp. AB-P1]|uniref:phasin family protein n=1 Tax=Evansella sp. AB-P1 TaxID=3037653 RepID=UPI00241C5E09|nr:polyhydroxyalkanoate synthesis regulator [Evansella sp. AB-P1]MDG5786344.1 polyhydroxyalkanoate synthesis regulator [Evansella sp. AB-P1]
MSDLFKKGFLLGLGVAVASKEKVEKYINELVSKGKVTPKEADELFDSLIKKGEETGDRWSRLSKEKARSVFDDLDIASKQDLEKLEQRIALLEKKLNEQSNE